MQEHPALLAWNKINSKVEGPISIEIIKKASKSKVFKLKGIGINSSDIIAKKGRMDKLKIEVQFYNIILPKFDFKSLKCYGLIQDNDEYFGWLFLEFAGNNEFKFKNKVHKQVFADWLFTFQRGTIQNKKVELPRKELDYYFALLNETNHNILKSHQNTFLNKLDIDVLQECSKNIEIVAHNWEKIESMSLLFPSCFTHGDIKKNNVRIRRSGAELSFLVFDWESAGWGTPLIDFDPLYLFFSKEELKLSYSKCMAYHQKKSFEEFYYCVCIGRVLRLIVSINWASYSLKFEWKERALRRIDIYNKSLIQVFQKIGW